MPTGYVKRPFALSLAAALLGGAGAGLVAFGWLQFGEAIYLTRLTAAFAGCF